MTEPKPTEPTNKVDTAKAVDPNVNSANESTPIGDAAQAAAAATPSPSNSPTPAEETAPPVVDEDEDEGLDTAKSYKVDVERALERQTQDGKGDEDPGPSDWQGYATEGVEKENDE